MVKEKPKMVQIWDKVAPMYGQIGPRYWATFGKRLVELSNIKEGARVLDIGTGRGAVLFPAVQRVGKSGKVIGIDFSEGMVAETYKELKEKKIENVEVIEMDATDLKFKEDFFDYAVGGFSAGILIFSEDRLKEVVRVLRKGGQVAFSTWGIQKDQIWINEITGKYLGVGTAGGKEKQKVELPDLNTVNGMTRILEQQGFKNIRVYEESNDVVYKDKEEWWQEMWSNAARGVFERIEELGKEEIEEAKAEIFDGLEKYKKEDGIHFNMPVVYSFGEK